MFCEASLPDWKYIAVYSCSFVRALNRIRSILLSRSLQSQTEVRAFMLVQEGSY